MICRGRGRDEELSRTLQTRLEKVQQAAMDALKCAREAESECASLHKQNTSLRDRIKDVERKQKVACRSIPWSPRTSLCI
jgi:IS1 family transposase